MPFKKGDPNINRKGRPSVPEIELLRIALDEAKEKHGISFIEHFVNLAYTNKEVAIALAKKLIPDKTKLEGDVNIILQSINYGDLIQSNPE